MALALLASEPRPVSEREHAIAKRLASEANLDVMLIEWTGFDGLLTIGDVETAIAATVAEGGQADNADELDPEDEALHALWEAEDLAAQAELDGTAALQALRAPVEEARKALEANSAAAARSAVAAADTKMQPETNAEDL